MQMAIMLHIVVFRLALFMLVRSRLIYDKFSWVVDE